MKSNYYIQFKEAKAPARKLEEQMDRILDSQAKGKYK